VSKPEIILVGAGGHCRSCIDVIEQENRFTIAGIVERLGSVQDESILGYPVVGSDDDLPKLRKQVQHALVTVGQLSSPAVRKKLFDLLVELEFRLPVIISPFAYVSRHASIGSGSIIMHHAIINACARIGCNGIINTKALIEHDAVIGDHCHVSTGAIVNGGASVGEGSFLGSQSCTVQTVALGENHFARAMSLNIGTKNHHESKV
jgi:sugar O-acyltransferase (sialic acid O-acetyltransferase NeuD family)